MPISTYYAHSGAIQIKTRNRDKGIRPSVVRFRVDMYEIGVYTLSLAGGLLVYLPPEKVSLFTSYENTYFVLFPPNVSRLITVSNGSSFMSLIWSRTFFISSEAVMNLPF